MLCLESVKKVAWESVMVMWKSQLGKVNFRLEIKLF